MKAEDFLKEDLEKTKYNNEVVEPIAEEIIAILRKHNMDILAAHKILNNVGAKLRRLQEHLKV